MLNHYTTLLIDIDDTLLDFQKAQHMAFQKLTKHFQLPYSDTLFQEYHALNQSYWQAYELGTMNRQDVLHNRFIDFFKRHNINVDGEKTDTLYRSYLTEGKQLIDGALSFLQFVKPTHQIAIVTNGVYDTQMARLENNALLGYFSHLFISDAVGYKKPDKAFFSHVFRTMQLSDLSKVLIIGDSLHADIQGGHNASIDTCWINLHGKPMTLDTAPTYTVNSIKELLLQ